MGVSCCLLDSVSTHHLARHPQVAHTGPAARTNPEIQTQSGTFRLSPAVDGPAHSFLCHTRVLVPFRPTLDAGGTLSVLCDWREIQEPALPGIDKHACNNPLILLNLQLEMQHTCTPTMLKHSTFQLSGPFHRLVLF